MCGRVRGYQYGYPVAFDCFIENEAGCSDLEEVRTYGVVFTYSSNPRKHIWTYTTGVYEQTTYSESCPCNGRWTYVSFIGNDYYCESGTSSDNGNVLYSNDPLWDGKDCPGREANCCTSPKLPWFVKTLNEIVSDNIELVACGYNGGPSYIAGAPIDLVELYIK